jgi:hypothetical protein
MNEFILELSALLFDLGNQLESHFTTKRVQHFLFGLAGDSLDGLPLGSQQERLQTVKKITQRNL